MIRIAQNSKGERIRLMIDCYITWPTCSCNFALLSDSYSTKQKQYGASADAATDELKESNRASIQLEPKQIVSSIEHHFILQQRNGQKFRVDRKKYHHGVCVCMCVH